MKPHFTIFHSTQILVRLANGELEKRTEVRSYPGHNPDPEISLEDLMQNLAEDEVERDNEMDDMDYQFEVDMALDQITGTFEVFEGEHTKRPDEKPVLIDTAD